MTATAFQAVPPEHTASTLHALYNEGHVHFKSLGTFSIVTNEAHVF